MNALTMPLNPDPETLSARALATHLLKLDRLISLGIGPACREFEEEFSIAVINYGIAVPLATKAEARESVRMALPALCTRFHA